MIVTSPSPLAFLRPLLVGIVMVVSLLTGCGSGSEDAGSDGAADAIEAVSYKYIIPSGTAERIEAGEQVDIMPSRLDLNIGDSIEIVNQDSQGHNVGPFYAGKGESVSQTFNSAAEYVDSCSVDPSGVITIVVS